MGHELEDITFGISPALLQILHFELWGIIICHLRMSWTCMTEEEHAASS